jgi:hypothetical protein
MNVTSFAAFVLATSATALAQCELQPTATGRGLPSLDRPAYCMCEWDPDGSGPLGPRLVVGGSFSLAGDLRVDGIAAFDPATGQWSPLPGLLGQVLSLAVLPNGLLIAGGLFATPAPSGTVLQVWTGTAWTAAIPQPNAIAVDALAVSPNGELYAACATGFGVELQQFVSGGWQLVGTAAAGALTSILSIEALAFDTNGDLLIGGAFGAIDSVAAAGVARWNGSSWSAIGSGVDGAVHDLLVTSSGALFASGMFAVGSPPVAANVAQWNGSSWQALGSGTQSTVLPFYAGAYALAESAGSVVAAGQFDLAGGVPAFKVAQWNGSVWSAMGGGIEQYGAFGAPSSVQALHRTSSGALFAVGDFRTVGGRDGVGLARWSGSTWAPARAVGVGNGTTAVHRTLTGEVYLGGSFLDIDGVVCNGIARRVGNGWQPLGSGIDDPFGIGPAVTTVCSLPSGDVVVGGGFPSAGGVPAPALAIWNGTNWSSLGSGLANSAGSQPWVQALHVAGNGDLYVAGSFDLAGGVAVDSVARWNGSQWSAVGSGLGPALLSAVASSPIGEVYIAGLFATGGSFQNGRIAVAVGGSWQTIGTANGPVFDLVVLPGGALLAAGAFQSIDGQLVGCVARWSGGVWAPLGGLGTTSSISMTQRLRELPGGGLLAAGFFETGASVAGFAYWNGSSWNLLGPDLFDVLDIAVDPSGEVLVAGSFTTVGGVASANFARLVAPCMATAVPAGNGCVGSGGLNQLTTSGLPWLGEIFTATASGMPTNSVGMSVLGLGTLSLSLPSLLPQGGAGCALLVTPDVLGLVLPSGGVAQVPLPLPLIPAFAGITLQLQVAPIEFGVGGAITAVTSTNRLSLTLGIF